jgi:hypothetical protein
VRGGDRHVWKGCANKRRPERHEKTNANASNPDGSMLKVTAPVPQSPVGGQRLEQGTAIPLVASNAVRHFADFAVTYR